MEESKMLSVAEVSELRFREVTGFYYDYYIRNEEGQVIAIKEAYVSISHDFGINYQTAEINCIDAKSTVYIMINLDAKIPDIFYAINIKKVLDLKANVIYEKK